MLEHLTEQPETLISITVLLYEMASLLPQSERTQLADDGDTEYQLLQECQADHLTDTSAYYNNSGHIPEVRKLKVSNVWWWLGGRDIYCRCT